MKGLLLLTVLFIGDTWSIEDVDGVKSHCPNTKECIHASSIFQDWNQILPKIKMTRAEYACNDCSKLCCLIKGCDAWVLNQRDNICLIGTVGSQRQLKYDQNSVSGTMECFNPRCRGSGKGYTKFLDQVSSSRKFP